MGGLVDNYTILHQQETGSIFIYEELFLFESVSGKINQCGAANNTHVPTRVRTHTHIHKLLQVFEQNTMQHANIIISLNNGGISGPLNHRTTSYLFSCFFFS